MCDTHESSQTLHIFTVVALSQIDVGHKIRHVTDDIAVDTYLKHDDHGIHRLRVRFGDDVAIAYRRQG